MPSQFVRWWGGFFRETEIVGRELSKAAWSGFAELHAWQLCKALLACSRLSFQQMQLFMLPKIKLQSFTP